MFRAVLILALLPAVAQASYRVGDRIYANPQTGQAYVGHHYVYAVDKYGCYYWQKILDAKQSYGAYDNHSTTLHLTVNNFQGSAKRGESQYATLDLGYKVGNPLDPNVTMNFAKELLGVAYRGANDGFKQAMSFASQHSANDLEVVQELVQVKKLEASALILESSKPEKSHRPKHHPVADEVPDDPPTTPVVGGLPGGLSVTEGKCKVCHDDGQKGGGVKLNSFATLDFKQADLAMEYVTKLDDENCAKRAKLTPEAHKELIDYLCQVKAKSK